MDICFLLVPIKVLCTGVRILHGCVSPSRMRRFLLSHSFLQFQSAQIPVDFLKYLSLPRKLQGRALRGLEVRGHCISSHLYLYSLHSLQVLYIIFNLISPQGISAKQAQHVKRPIQIGPKFSIQPKPLITAVPLAPAAAAPLQTKTIILQPLQTTVLPVVKPAPVTIQRAHPAGQNSHYSTLDFQPFIGLFCTSGWKHLQAL